MDRLLDSLGHKRVGKSHKLVNDNERDAESSAKCKDLLTNSVTEGNGAIGFLVHDFGQGGICNHVAGTLDNLAIQVTDDARVDV